MAKILRLKAPNPKPSEPTGSKAWLGLQTWLESRPENTRNNYTRIAKDWITFRGYEPESLSSQRGWVDAKHIDAQKYVNACKKRPAQPGRATEASADGKVSMNTIRHKVVVLKSIYDQLIAQGFVEVNPFERLNIELRKHQHGARRPHARIPTDAVKQLLTFKPKDRRQLRDLAIFHLLFGAALRRSEVVNLRLQDVKRSDKGTTYLRLAITKSQKVQEVALAEWVAATVNQYVDARIEEGATIGDPLFVVYRVNERYTSLSDSTIYRMFKKYCKRFKLPPNFTPHCARVTAITQMLDQGYSHREVQELSRHGSVVMVEKYDRKRKDLDESSSKGLKY